MSLLSQGFDADADADYNDANADSACGANGDDFD